MKHLYPRSWANGDTLCILHGPGPNDRMVVIACDSNGQAEWAAECVNEAIRAPRQEVDDGHD